MIFSVLAVWHRIIVHKYSIRTCILSPDRTQRLTEIIATSVNPSYSVYDIRAWKAWWCLTEHIKAQLYLLFCSDVFESVLLLSCVLTVRIIPPLWFKRLTL